VLSCLDQAAPTSNKRFLVIRFVGRIVLLVALALFGAFGAFGALDGDPGGFTGAPPVAPSPARVSASVAPEEPAPDPESTASLDESPEDDSVGVALARSPGEPCAVIAPSFARAPVLAQAQAAPPMVVHETPPRPPRS
jgi:hypothetical protein